MKTYIVDSFTKEAFKGNPAGVCLVDTDLTEKKMLNIAQELNLSETAFVSHIENNKYNIRYFSPIKEIPLCGHATLASSKILFKLNDFIELEFTTIEGIKLNISKVEDEILMLFPLYNLDNYIAPEKLVATLGLSKVLDSKYNKETNILLLEIESTEELKNLSPNFSDLIQSHDGIDGVLITAKSNSNDGFDFHSRYFWPWSGSNEDPVTGGTHTFLTPYWSEKLGKKKMRSFQSSKRTGFMEVEIIDKNSIAIKSQAVIVFEGTLKI